MRCRGYRTTIASVPNSVRISINSIFSCSASRFFTTLVYNLPARTVGKYVFYRSFSPFTCYEVDVEALVIFEIAACAIE